MKGNSLHETRSFNPRLKLLYAAMLSTGLVCTAQADVSVTASGTVPENGTAQGTFVINSTTANTSGVPINITFSLSSGPTFAANNQDYQLFDATANNAVLTTTTIAIANNASNAVITANAIQDLLIEGDEPITLTLTSSSNTTSFPISSTAASATATLMITDDDKATTTKPLVSVEATTNALEPTTSGKFTIKADPAPSSDRTVYYTVTSAGTGKVDAEANVDYVGLTGSVTLTSSSPTATVDVNVIDDKLVEGDEYVTITLNDGGSEYTLGTSKSASLTITDNDVSATAQRVHLFDTNEITTTAIGDTNQISPPNPANTCAHFGIVAGGTVSTKTFTLGSTALSGSPDSVTSIGFSPNPDNLFQRSGGSSVKLQTLYGLGKSNPVTGTFEISFNPPVTTTTSPVSYSRMLEIFTSDPLAKPIEVPIGAFVVPNNMPNIQILEAQNGTTTPIDFGTVNVGESASKTFTVKNIGYGDLSFTSTTPGFSGTGFSINPYQDTIVPAPEAVSTSSGCPTTLTHNSTTFSATFTPSKEGSFTGTITVTGKNNTGTQLAPYVFPVKGTATPPPPPKAEIEVWDGSTNLTHDDKATAIDFGTVAVGASPIQKTFTIKNISYQEELNIYKVALPDGFSLVNPNYYSIISPGGSLDLKFQLNTDASALPSPNGAIEINSNDYDNDGNGVIENPFTFYVKGKVTGIASAQKQLAFTAPTGGSVKSEPAGIDCGGLSTICTANYETDISVKLTATPDSGYTFTRFDGDCNSTDNPLTVQMTAAKDCQAVFTQQGTTPPTTGGNTGGNTTDPNLLAITVTKPTNGSVISNPGGINCGTNGDTCTANFIKDGVVVLTATADDKAKFTEWGSDCSGTETQLILNIDAAKNCTATFTVEETPPVTTGLALTLQQPTGGNISSQPTGINCGSQGTNCSANFAQNAIVVLTPQADTDKQFSSWSGDCSGSSNPLVLEINAAKNCSATFEDVSTTTPPVTSTKFKLTVQAPTNGTITSSPAGIECGTSCESEFATDETVTLTAQPATDATFSGWTGECSGSGTTVNVTMNAAKSCGATFTKTPTVQSNCFDNQNGVLVNNRCVSSERLGAGSNFRSGATDVEIVGGLSKASGPYSQEVSVTLTDAIDTAGTIKIAPQDVGKQADIVVTGIHYSNMYDSGFAWYMLDGCNTCVSSWTYDKRDALPLFEELRGLTTLNALPDYLTVDMYSGNFVFPGFLDIFFGYRVIEGSEFGKVILSTTPINITITDPDTKESLDANGEESRLNLTPFSSQ